MPKASSPILRICPQVERHFAEGFFTCAYGQEMMIKPRIAMTIKQASGKMRAVAADEYVSPSDVFHQSPYACAIEYDFCCVKTANGFFGQAAGVAFIADSDVAAKAHALGCPGEQQDRQNRAAEFGQFNPRRPHSSGLCFQDVHQRTDRADVIARFCRHVGQRIGIAPL